MSKDQAIPDFEHSLAELETLVEKMEQGELTLEQSLEHYERGVQLTRACQQALEQAQLRIEQLADTPSDDAADADDDD